MAALHKNGEAVLETDKKALEIRKLRDPIEKERLRIERELLKITSELNATAVRYNLMMQNRKEAEAKFAKAPKGYGKEWTTEQTEAHT